ncbi:hypothetical protein GH714_030121 [Hevea brasiliensis]|uniref:Uncharacterized protein n=1 Tax=Hevea brasiliensis TaxID=3981 RepID=A0A6A6LG15_HEVBR|nr:hypothetical protein GH714_030121 [Hevea brasiliensis]
MLIYGSMEKQQELCDTGATDNFIADRAALQFQLNMQEDTGKIKAVNSKATNIVGVARRVSCQMGSWNGEIDFTVIPLDDFDVHRFQKQEAIRTKVVSELWDGPESRAIGTDSSVPFWGTGRNCEEIRRTLFPIERKDGSAGYPIFSREAH